MHIPLAIETIPSFRVNKYSVSLRLFDSLHALVNCGGIVAVAETPLKPAVTSVS